MNLVKLDLEISETESKLKDLKKLKAGIVKYMGTGRKTTTVAQIRNVLSDDELSVAEMAKKIFGKSSYTTRTKISNAIAGSRKEFVKSGVRKWTRA